MSSTALKTSLPETRASGEAVETYTIDTAHSEAAFQIRHLVTRVRGRFQDFAGTIRIDRAHPERSSVEFSIDAASIDTDVADRDAHLKSADFFDVENFPKITFVSSRIQPAGEDRYDVSGTFTMRGVSKPITLPVTFLGYAKDPWGNEKAGFELETKLNRRDFGMVWNAALDNGGVILGDEVRVAINLETLKERAASAR
jgi:polyisoprenoid-binding protein YceI